MGYSCTALASFTLEALTVQLHAESNPKVESSNGWNYDGNEYFFERGREQSDGAITGSIYRNGNGSNGIAVDRCRRVASAKILPNGKIKSWSFASKNAKKNAEANGLKRFTEVYGEEEAKRQVALAS